MDYPIAYNLDTDYKKNRKELVLKPGITTKQMRIHCSPTSTISAIVDNRRNGYSLRFSLLKAFLPATKEDPNLLVAPQVIFYPGELYRPKFSLRYISNDMDMTSIFVRIECIRYDYSKDSYQPCSDCRSIIVINATN